MAGTGAGIAVGALVAAGAATSSAAPAPVAPPGAAATPTISIDVTARRHAIAPEIYGASYATDAFIAAARPGVVRWGGNRATRYNFRTGTTNAGFDWYFENVTEDYSPKAMVREAAAAGRSAAVTVPMLGWVAKDMSSCGFPSSDYATQDDWDYAWRPNCGNGQSGGTPLDVTQAPAITSDVAEPGPMTTWFKRADIGGKPLIYQLDNEPTLWNSTHHDVHPDPISGNELFHKSTETADIVVAHDPRAVVSGPGDWGWCAYFFYPTDPGHCSNGSDKAAHGGLDLAAQYLKTFKAHDTLAGHRTLDIFDEHFYPQTGVFTDAAGDASQQALRLRSTRALWDPSYVDESWINKPVKLIPRMKAWVAKYYPGTKLGIGEYNFGATEFMNGALAEADVLGILGREGVSYAALWAPPTTATSPTSFAFRMFRNLDGNGAAFGTTSVKATSLRGSADAQGDLAVYAATRADGTLTVVVINKTGAAITSPVNVTHMTLAARGTRYTYSAADTSRIVTSSLRTSALGAVTFPAESITTLVLPKAA